MRSDNSGAGDGATPAAGGVVAPWFNIALRALDTTVATSQNLVEGADRLARAGAAEPPPQARVQAVGPAVWGGGRAALAYAMAVAGALQRSTLSLLADGWRQWFNTMGVMASVAARSRQAGDESVAAPAGWSEPAHATAAAAPNGSRRSARRRPARPRGEHAMAAGTPKRRRNRRTARGS